jgi:DNA-binding response OmpR family regulator
MTLQPRILIVDDSANDVELTVRALAENDVGCHIQIAKDGEEAILLLESDFKKLPALVLLDLKLPKKNGFEVLKEIRSCERLRMLPVVILSSSREERDIGQSYDLGANAYVVKPVSFNVFVQNIKLLSGFWTKVNEPPPCNL